MKSYLVSDGSVENLKTASQLPSDERNKHHNRARTLAVIGFLLMFTIVAIPLGLPVTYLALREANKGEAVRQSANG